MNDIDRRLREVLAAKADSLPVHREMPPTLRGRVRRRMAVNAMAAGAVVAVVAVGAFAGLRVFGASTPPRPLGSPTPTSSVSGAVASCTAGQLRAVGTLEGAAGSRLGAVEVTNLSDTRCTLTGTPAITLLDQNLQPISTGITFGRSPADWQVNASPQPPGWPIVTLDPGGVASFRLLWSNWCPDGRGAPLWRVGIPSSGTVDVNGLDAVSPPPCNGPGQPATVEVGPFEPKPAA